MEKTVYITEEEREKCRKVIDVFEELYEIEDEDILMLVGMALLNCNAIQRHMALRSLTPIQTVTAYLRGFGRNGLV